MNDDTRIKLKNIYKKDVSKLSDLLNETTALTEANKLNIPVIALADSNVNPDNVDIVIPGNDDARRSIDLYCNLIKETIQNASKDITKKIPEEKKEQIKNKDKIISPKDKVTKSKDSPKLN